jgi:hypothetical protein
MIGLTDAELEVMRSSINELLPDTCDILSVTNVSDGQGGWNETLGTATAGVDCRLDYVRDVKIVSGGALQTYTGWMLTLPYDAVITETNKVQIGADIWNVTSHDDGKSWQACIRVAMEKTE